MYEFCHHVNRINGPRIDVFNWSICKETIATSSRTMYTRLCWAAIDWLTDLLYISFFRNRETAKRSRREYSASVPEIWYQKLWHGVARCCRRRWVFKRFLLVSTCLQSFARVPWCTARSSFRKTCFADKKNSSLERAHVYNFNSVMSVVHLLFYRLVMSYKHET